MCAKINSKASPNSVVIGDNLYQIVRAFDEYSFEPVGAYSGRSTTSGPYLIYCVVAKYDRHILNPFKRKPIR